MLLIKKIDVYAPKHLGIKDVLVCGGKITLIKDNIESFDEGIEIIDGKGKLLLPGLIDQHVHITGGGGEGSFKTRVPEITLSKITTAGITTVVGLLGTDSTTRSVENLIAKAKGLKEDGVSVYAITGSYEYPTITLTESVRKDICYIDEIIGAKVAISDHRSSSITNNDLAKLASNVRVAGMLAGKAGILVLHMGDGSEGLNPVFHVLENTELPVRTMRPTHVNKNDKLLNQGLKYISMGGMIDLTCGGNNHLRPSNIIMQAIKENLPLENITISSDGYGSWSKYDNKGNLLEIGVASVGNLFDEFKHLVQINNLPIDEALIYFTTNVSKGLSLYPQKGTITEGCDGDLLIINKDLEIDTVIAKGNVMIRDKKVLIKGVYE